MTEPIISRERIESEAEAAVRAMADGQKLTNPYPAMSGAAEAWKAAVTEFLNAESEVRA